MSSVVERIVPVCRGKADVWSKGLETSYVLVDRITQAWLEDFVAVYYINFPHSDAPWLSGAQDFFMDNELDMLAPPFQ